MAPSDAYGAKPWPNPSGHHAESHDLRHTHAAWLIADGEHPKAIQTRLGHGSIAVTMDRYGHLMDGLDDQIALHLDLRARSAAPPARPERIRDPPGIGL